MDTATIFTKLIIMFVLLCSENVYLLISDAVVFDEQVMILCKDKERDTLLSLKQGLQNMPDYESTGLSSTSYVPATNISSWASEVKECCYWAGVRCSNRTGHVSGLKLSGLRGEISPALLELRYLNSLVLNHNDFGGNKIPEFIGSLDKLEYLDLSISNFSGDVPYQLGNLSNLKELNLFRNDLTSNDISWLFNLTSLSILDLSFNELGGPLSWLPNLTLLSSVNLSNNHFEGSIPELKAFSSLRALNLNDNNLTGSIPTSIGQLSNLTHLDVSNNSLEGTITEVHFAKLYNLTYLHLPFRGLVLNFTTKWIPPFQLDWIGLAGCNMGPRFPSWLQTQSDVVHLDISYAGILAEVPNWFWNHSALFQYLNLSNNNMSGFIPDLSPNSRLPDPSTTSRIDISFNNFSGPLPLFHRNSFILDLSHNKFSGTIQSMCRVNYSSLQLLDLSQNQLSGDISNCFDNMTNLTVINLADNKFDGHIPPSIESLGILQSLILRNNNFTGELPSALSGCKILKLIDCRGNQLTGKVPTWMGSLASLVYLILGQNNFYGDIPPEICHLSLIQVLDLSHNNISGRIPHCFQNFTSLIQNNGSTDAVVRINSHNKGYTYVVNVIVMWKKQELEYRNTLKFLKLIDLSRNNLMGNIPHGISHLAGLASLNLSQNHLTGSINSNIGQMEKLECLDLSQNKLSGVIPTGLAELHYLGVLDLSHNNLSGKIPKSTQLQSFDVSAYAWNEGLCGDPLPNCRDEATSSVTRGNHGNINEEFNLIESLLEEYLISVLLGFIVGLWVIIGPLLFKESWRNSNFGLLSMIGDWLLITATLSWTRVMRCVKIMK